MSQSRARSPVEAATNVVLGYGLAVATQIAVFPAFGLSVGIAENLRIGAIFTGVSLARSYVLRRFFNSLALGTGEGSLRATDGVATDARP